MAENIQPSDNEKKTPRQVAYEKAERMKTNLMKLEKSVIDEVDEATQAARGAMRAMGFGVSKIKDNDEEDDK